MVSRLTCSTRGLSQRIATNRKMILPAIERYSGYIPTCVTLKDFIKFGSEDACEKTSYIFLRKELLVRLANIMQEINLLPEQLLRTASVQMVESWYQQSFQEIIQFERLDPNDKAVQTDFVETLYHVRNRHVPVVETMAEGVLEMKQGIRAESQKLENQIQYFLDRFYMSRISIRMLINQHTLLFGGKCLLANHRHIGAIDPYCDVLDVAEDAYENARFLCDQYYMSSPGITYQSHNPYEEVDKITITYVPSHLYHMLFELFKNALRAVVEYHSEADTLPKVHVMICKGHEDLTIKISDQGGGIRHNKIDSLYNYMYSTATRPPSPASADSTPLAGYGYGLPLSRLYAKYFNGDLSISSVEGYGTDANICLRVFPDAANELLPIFNKTSYLKYSQSIPVGDWSNTSQTTGLHGAVHRVGGIPPNTHQQIRTKTSNTGGAPQQQRMFSMQCNAPNIGGKLHRRHYSTINTHVACCDTMDAKPVPNGDTTVCSDGPDVAPSVLPIVGEVVIRGFGILPYLLPPVFVNAMARVRVVKVKTNDLEPV